MLLVAETFHVTDAFTGVAAGRVPCQIVPAVFVIVIAGCTAPLNE